MNDFAKILEEITKYYNPASIKNPIAKIQNDMLKHLMDRCLRVASHLVPPGASEAAINRANNHGIDIFKLQEKDRNKVENKIKKSDNLDEEKFILEHFYPVNQIINDMLTVRNQSEKTFENAISKLKVVWVLKSEDEALNKNGHRTKRPNPYEAYERAGIKLNEENPYGVNWLNQT